MRENFTHLMVNRYFLGNKLDMGINLRTRESPIGETLLFMGDFGDRLQNTPAAVWTYKLGGYQVAKKWLSYRERDVLDRSLKPEEIQHFTDMARRIQGIILSMSQDPST